MITTIYPSKKSTLKNNNNDKIITHYFLPFFPAILVAGDYSLPTKKAQQFLWKWGAKQAFDLHLYGGLAFLLSTCVDIVLLHFREIMIYEIIQLNNETFALVAHGKSGKQTIIDLGSVAYLLQKKRLLIQEEKK